MPQHRVRPVVDTARPQCRRERPAGEVIGSERGVGRDPLDRPVYLAAGRALLVDQHGVEAELVGEHRGGHAGGTGADDRELDHRHPASGSIVRARIWRLIRIPGCTSIMQLRWFAAPSISARQSKQTPIMQ